MKFTSLKKISLFLGIILVIIQIVSPSGLVPTLVEFINPPDFHVSLEPLPEYSNKFRERLIIENVGKKQISDVTVHISSSDPIWKINQLCSEVTSFSDNATDYKINFNFMSTGIPCTMDFASNSKVGIFNVDIVGKDANGKHYDPWGEKFLLVLLLNIGLIITIIILLVLPIFLKKQKGVKK